MASFFDARCSRCGRRFGWSGEMAHRPPCPKCNYRPPQAELDAADAEIRAAEESILNRPPEADRIRKLRIAAGLTLRDAAKRLGVSLSDLNEIEFGQEEATAEFKALMETVYGEGKC